MIRILQIIGSMGAGGAETMIMNWYRGIDRTKVQFDFLVHHQAESCYEEEIRKLGGNIYHLSFADDHNLFKYKKDLKQFFDEHKYKIVHGHHSSYGMFYLKAAKDAGVSVRISHSHIASYSRTMQGYIFFILSRRYHKYANVHFACSNAAGKYMYGEKPYTVINNGIDTTRFHYDKIAGETIRKELGLNSEATVLVHVGRFHHQKNHKFLADIFKVYHSLNSNSYLLLVGEGPLQEVVKKQVNDYGIADNVKFLNNRMDVPAILSASDVFVFPSFYEGLPLTLVEAQASGLPIVCSDAITDETRLTNTYYALSLNDDVSKWCDAIEKCGKTINDRNKAAMVVKAAGYDSNDVAKQIQDYYLSKNDEI